MAASPTTLDDKIAAILTEMPNRIRYIREAKGLTQGDAAVRAGITESALSMIESGVRKPSLPVLLRVAEALDVEAGHLISKPKPKHRKEADHGS